MIRFVGLTGRGNVHIGLGLTKENVTRLQRGEPIFIDMADARLQNIEISITYGETIEDVQIQWAHNGITFDAGPPPEPEP